MAFNPGMYPPYPPLGIGQQPVNGLIPVNGRGGADAYPMPPNSAVALFDENEDIMFIKRTDGAGFPTVLSYRFEPLEQPAPEGAVTREEFDRLVAAVEKLTKEADDGEQPVPTEPEQPGQ